MKKQNTFICALFAILETLDFTIRLGCTPTFPYFDLYLYSAYAAPDYVYFTVGSFTAATLCQISRSFVTVLYLLSVLAVHQPFYISICISTLPTQHTKFI